MSTMMFSEDELANVALVACGNPRTEYGRHMVNHHVRALARYAAANCNAYNDNYPNENAEPVTAAEIEEAARRMTANATHDRDLAARTVRLLRYNLDSGRKDFATPEILDSLLTIANGVMAAYVD